MQRLAGIRGSRRELPTASCGMSAGWHVVSTANGQDLFGMPAVFLHGAATATAGARTPRLGTSAFSEFGLRTTGPTGSHGTSRVSVLC